MSASRVRGSQRGSSKGGSNVQYQCIKSEAEIETDKLGNKHIKKLILK